MGEETATYLPGHRQIHFNGEWDAVSRGVEQLYRQLFVNYDHFNRYKNSWAEDQFRSELRILQNRETEYLRTFHDDIQGRRSFRVARDGIKDSPLDRVNETFAQARLPVQLIPTRDGLSVRRGSLKSYSLEKLSDGERAALYIAASFMNRRTGTVLLIDEPEKHLGQNIASVFIAACIRMRQDIAVILSTHDPRLIDRLADKEILHVRNSEVTCEKPERRLYSVSPVRGDADGLDELKKDLLGIRSRVLFVEGDASSLDIPLYSHVYPDVRIIPKGGFQGVCDATRGIGRLVDGHWLEPRGLIDGDGREEHEKLSLSSDGIHVLPVPAVENLFFVEQGIRCFVEADMHHRGGKSEEERMDDFRREVKAAVEAARADIISQRISWRVVRELSGQKISPKEVRDGHRGDLVVSVSGIYSEVETQVDRLIHQDDAIQIIRATPIKRTPVPNRIVKALGAEDFNHYTQVILRRIELAEPSGDLFLMALRSLLPQVFGGPGPRLES